MADKISEHELQRQIITVIKNQFLGNKVIKFERRNSGLIRRKNADFAAYAYSAYLPAQLETFHKGLPDIDGVLIDGRYFMIEVKTKSGDLSSEQKIFRDHANKYKIPYLLARSIDDVYNFFNNI